jgi:hypothetical protein
MRTTVKTIRIPHSLNDQIVREAERQRTTAADIHRLALTQYFDRRLSESALLGIEQRLTARLDAHGQLVSTGLAKILSLAEPVQGVGP